MSNLYPNNNRGKISVLINAYACNPRWGSEPGMGWNWVINIAKFCEVFVITEGEWKDNIEEAVSLLPQKNNIHFFYLPVSDRIRKMCWNQGDWRFYYYYKKWQKRAYEKALQIISEHKIDIVHQLNMVGFREPGFLYKIEGIPFVWGPIGGMNNFPEEYLKGARLKFRIFSMLKNRINLFQIKYSKRVKKALLRADCLVSAVPTSNLYIKRYHGLNSIVIGETGCDLKDDSVYDYNRFFDSKTFDILWVGQVYFRKQLSLALRTISLLKENKKIRLHIVSPATESEIECYKNEAENLGISELCVWHGKLKNSEVHELMQKYHLFFFTSVVDETSTVILEAIGSGLPILCFDTCGFGPIVDESLGYKIPISNPDKSIKEFSQIIKYLEVNREELVRISKSGKIKTDILSWSYKAKQLVDCYYKTFEKYNEKKCSN